MLQVWEPLWAKPRRPRCLCSICESEQISPSPSPGRGSLLREKTLEIAWKARLVHLVLILQEQESRKVQARSIMSAQPCLVVATVQLSGTGQSHWPWRPSLSSKVGPTEPHGQNWAGAVGEILKGTISDPLRRRSSGSMVSWSTKIFKERSQKKIRCTPKYIPKRTENIHPHKNSYVDVHSSIIHNSQKVETNQMSIMDKQNVVYPYIFIPRIVLSNKQKWSTDTCDNVDEPWKRHA